MTKQTSEALSPRGSTLADAGDGPVSPSDPDPRSGGPSDKSSSEAEQPTQEPCYCPVWGPEDGGDSVAAPTALDALETNQHALPEQSRPQAAIHARFEGERATIWNALHDSDEEKLQRRASKLAQCCQMPTIRLSSSGEVLVCPQRCRDRLCPLCSVQRAKKTGERANEACKRMNMARLITLTVPHTSGPLSGQIKAIRAAFGRLRRSKSWKKHVDGGVYGFEVKLSGADACWHPHLHVIADGEFYDKTRLREDWRDALNHPSSPWNLEPDDPLATSIDFIRNRREAAKYVAKYIAKPQSLASWPPPALREFASAMAGQRLISTFGSLHGVTLDAADPNRDPAETTHVAGIFTLNTAAGRGQRSAQVALLLFRLAFPKLSNWTRRDIVELPNDALLDGESIINALARIAAEADREFWRTMEAGHAKPVPERHRRRKQQEALNLPF